MKDFSAGMSKESLSKNRMKAFRRLKQNILHIEEHF